MRRLASAALFGSMFGLGLGVSGMTQPGKVIGFLDLFGGHWDPSLALVMGGAIAVHMPLAWWWRRRMARPPSNPIARKDDQTGGPDDGPETDAQTSRAAFARVNPRLVVGAAIFGVGWGLGGYCPGPALVTLVGFSPGILVFVASMMMGMWLFHLLSGRDPADLPISSRPPASVTALPWVRGSEKTRGATRE
jgi:uncharacterized membrane protein YedE/YeeE